MNANPLENPAAASETTKHEEMENFSSFIYREYRNNIYDSVVVDNGEYVKFDDSKLEALLINCQENISQRVAEKFGKDIKDEEARSLEIQTTVGALDIFFCKIDPLLSHYFREKSKYMNLEEYQYKAVALVKKLLENDLERTIQEKEHGKLPGYHTYERIEEALWVKGVAILKLFVVGSVDGGEAQKDKVDGRGLIDILIKKIRVPGFYSERSRSFSNEADICSLDLEYAASQLMNNIRSEKDRLARDNLTKLLYHLEFGRIGISQDGVKYLTKLYDLSSANLNNPDYFVHRLTTKGDIGVFDGKKVLIKYFRLGDIASEEQTIQPEVLDFAYETLFFPREDESPEKKAEREKYLEEFKQGYFKFYEDDFFQKTGVRFNNLNFREQGWFLEFYKNAGDEKKEELFGFARSHGEDGLKSFLSLEFGEDLGNNILEIGKKLESFQAGKVFGKIAELADLANEEEKEFQKLLARKESINLSRMQLELLKKAHRIILDFSGEEKDIGNLLKDLEDTKIEIALLSAMLKTFRADGKKVNYDLIRDLKLEKKDPGKDLSPEEKEEMLKLFQKNYREVVFPNDPSAATAAIEEFKKDLYSSEGLADNIVFTLRFQGQLIAFCRFKNIGEKEIDFLRLENVEPNALYAASLNVHREVNSLTVGRYFSDAVLGEMFQNFILYGITRADNSAISMYEKQGFRVDRTKILRKPKAPKVKYYGMKSEMKLDKKASRTGI